jgi:hypothetical protein
MRAVQRRAGCLTLCVDLQPNTSWSVSVEKNICGSAHVALYFPKRRASWRGRPILANDGLETLWQEETCFRALACRFEAQPGLAAGPIALVPQRRRHV